MPYDIKSKYVSNSSIVKEFGEKYIQEKYDSILLAMNNFIQETNLKNAEVNKAILWHVILDCYTDIYRMKSFHNVKEVNDIKITAYESYWLLKRKPLQIVKSDDEQSIFINEKFVLSLILSFISKDDNDNLDILANEKMEYFTATLFYFLKYRIKNPQTLELMLLAFDAGKEYQR
jgi:hypothetical protein